MWLDYTPQFSTDILLKNSFSCMRQHNLCRVTHISGTHSSHEVNGKYQKDTGKFNKKLKGEVKGFSLASEAAFKIHSPACP